MQPTKTVIGTNGAIPFLALYYQVAPTKRDLREVETAKKIFEKIGVKFKVNRWHDEVNIVPAEGTEDERTAEELIELCRRFLTEAGLRQNAEIDPHLTVYEKRGWNLADLAEAFSIESLPRAHSHSLVIGLNREFPHKEVFRLKSLIPETFQVRVEERQIVIWPRWESFGEPAWPLAALQWYRQPLQALGMWHA